MQSALLSALVSGSVHEVLSLGREWETTATVLADPQNREMLLGRPTADDFVEVSRPA